MMSSPGVPDSRDYPETGGGLAYAAGEVVATNAIAASPTMSPNVLLRGADVVRPIVGVGTQNSSGGFIDHFNGSGSSVAHSTYAFHTNHDRARKVRRRRKRSTSLMHLSLPSPGEPAKMRP